MHYYKAFSLNIASDFEFPQLAEGSSSNKIDLTIKIGKTPDRLEGPDVLTRVRNQSKPGQFLIKIPYTGNIYIEDGKRMVVNYTQSSDITYLKTFILTRGLAAVLHQRHWIPIHASGIEVNNKAVLFAGHSGAGKSTTTSAFVKKGYPFISDDICIIKKEPDHSYKVYHSYPQIRLWEDSMDMISDPTHNKDHPIGNKLNKYSVEPSGKIISEPKEISHIYILQNAAVDQEKFKTIDSLTKLEELRSLTFAKSQLKGMGGAKEQFEAIAYLIKNCEIKILQQPLVNRDIWRLRDIVENDFLSKVISS